MAFLSFTKTTYTPLSIPQILLVALRLPLKSLSLSFPLFLLALLSSASFLLLFSSSVSPPLLRLLSNLSLLFKHPNPPTPPNFLPLVKNDLVAFLSVASPLVPLFSLLYLLLTIATVLSLSSTYSHQPLPLSPMALISRAIRRAYPCAITFTYLLLFGIGYIVLSTTVVGTTLLVTTTNHERTLGITTCTSLASLSLLLLLYLATRGAVSVVVSVVEDTWGIGALSWSVELFIGNKQRGTVLTSILVSLRTALLYVAFAIAVRPGPPEEQRKLVALVAAVVAIIETYCWSVYTVFYYECRKSHGLEDFQVYSSLLAHDDVKVVDAYVV